MSLPSTPTFTPEIKLDLSGDRAIEWSWVSANIPDGPGNALDFGPGGSQLSTIAAMSGYDVTGVDMLDIERPFVLPNLKFLKGDLNSLPLIENYFDLVTNCSTVEHSGITGRYSIEKEDHDADLKAMSKLRSLMKRDAIQLLTVPIGVDAVWRPLHRIYGSQRMPLLLAGYKVLTKRCWVKDRYNRWVLVNEKEAFARETAPEVYGLGCYKIVRDD
jgi:Caenorhabditis protein of unknown function, DUF268